MKCEVCSKEYPWYLISKTFVYSREYCGKVIVCDFCFKTEDGKELRKYDGFTGYLRRKLRDIWERRRHG